MDLSSNRYINRSFWDIRLDQSPDRLCLSGSGFPNPEDGSSDRSISLRSLHKALCSRLSVSRMASYASQVLPSNTSDLIHLLISWFVALSTSVGFKRVGNLLHEILALEYVKGFLFSLPIVGTYHNEGLTSTPSDLERFVSANYLFHKAFQVVSEFIYANCVHNLTTVYGNTVQLYTENPNKAKQSDPFSVPPLALLQMVAC